MTIIDCAMVQVFNSSTAVHKPSFNPRPVHMTFLVDNVELGQIIGQVVDFPLQV